MVAKTPIAAKQKTALVVDDSKLARYVLKEMLVEQGIKVETAESAEEALGSLSASKPDVIFMDHMMPGMDGFQAVQAIKNDPKTAMIPIMMYTSKDEGVYVSQARALGAVGVLPKKLKPVQLEKVLMQLNLVKGKVVSEKAKVSSSGPSTPGSDKIAAPKSSTGSAEKVAVSNSNHTLEELARSANEELEKDSMRLLFRQLFVEQRDAIKQDQHEFVKSLVDQVTPVLISERQKAPLWQMLALSCVTLLLVSLLLPMYGVFNINDEHQAKIESQLTQQQELIVDLQKQLDNFQAQSTKRIVSTSPKLNVKTLEWAINQNSKLKFHESFNSNKNHEFIEKLVSQLDDQSFSGVVTIKYHEGLFCQQKNEKGDLVLANDSTEITNCKFKSFEPDGGLQTGISEFEYFLSVLKQDYKNIEVEFEPMGAQYTIEDYPDPAVIKNANEWNRIAKVNNRLEYVIQPEDNQGQYSLSY